MISDEIISTDEIISLLYNFFPSGAEELNFISKGVFSQAFSFRADSSDYIIRIGSSEEGFRKDEFAYHNFLRPELPIPEVLTINRYDPDHFYCITRKMRGKTMQELSIQEERDMIPAFASCINHLRKMQVPRNILFGTLNSSGQAQFNSWRAFITNFSNWNQLIHKGANENFLDFEELFRTTFLDPMLFSKCKNAILELSPYCPEDKNYVHGDFGFGNLLIDGNKITGILDWAELLCGDFLVDIAALDYGRDTNSFSSFFEEFCRQESIPIPHFHERLRCYKIIMALKSMYLEANRNQPEWYDEEVGKLKKMGIG